MKNIDKYKRVLKVKKENRQKFGFWTKWKKVLEETAVKVIKDLYDKRKRIDFIMINKAAKTIQSFWRKKRFHKRVYERVKDKTKALILIQKYCRGYLSFTKYLLPRRMNDLERSIEGPRFRIQTDSQIKISYLFRSFKRRNQRMRMKQMEAKKKQKTIRLRDISFGKLLLRKLTNKSDLSADTLKNRSKDDTDREKSSLLSSKNQFHLKKLKRRSSLAPPDFSPAKKPQLKFVKAGYLKPTVSSIKKSDQDRPINLEIAANKSLSEFSQAENSSPKSCSKTQNSKRLNCTKKSTRRSLHKTSNNNNPKRSKNSKTIRIKKCFNTSKLKTNAGLTIRSFKKTKQKTFHGIHDYKFKLTKASPAQENDLSVVFRGYNV